MFDAFSSALYSLLDVKVLLLLLTGVFIGIVFGALPGLSSPIAMSVVLPLTFGMDPKAAIYLFVGIMGAVAFAGSIPAILLNTPGTAPNAVTCFDGFPMARKGMAGMALGISATASALGSLFGVVVLIILLPLMQIIVMAFSPPEYFMLILFGLVCVAASAGKNFLKGLLISGIGLLISFVGYSPVFGIVRFTGGSVYLFDGIQFIPVVVGVLAVSELLHYTAKGGAIAEDLSSKDFSGVLDGVKEVFRHKMTLIRSAAVGTIIGMIPAVGGTTANFIAYSLTVRASKDPDSFGKGNPEGVIAAEAANDAKDGGALIPTLAFGIPGSAHMAVLLGAFILHGIVPGPLLIRDNMDIVWVLIIGLVISNLLVSSIGLVSAPFLAKITTLKVSYIAPIVLVLCTFGTYAIRRNIWDIAVLIIFGILGYCMKRFGFPTISFVIGYILGKLAERAFTQSIMISSGDYSIFFTRPVSLTIFIILILVIILPILDKMRRKKGGNKIEEVSK
ncbi:MAG: tripartite tricarboxylate transporter permease [Bacillota bacterium]|nr:tripartite tricarboxylate transporter permease [Bacillota bacterium]